jgi:hypothetical protein
VIDPDRIRALADNVLVRLDIHLPKEERRTAGGIVIPHMEEWEYTLGGEDKRAVKTPNANAGQWATVVAAGPGHYRDKWLGLEEGTAPDGSPIFVPMDPDIQPGARVLVEDARCGDRLFSTEYHEYRMVRERNLALIAEEA